MRAAHSWLAPQRRPRGRATHHHATITRRENHLRASRGGSLGVNVTGRPECSCAGRVGSMVARALLLPHDRPAPARPCPRLRSPAGRGGHPYQHPRITRPSAAGADRSTVPASTPPSTPPLRAGRARRIAVAVEVLAPLLRSDQAARLRLVDPGARAELDRLAAALRLPPDAATGTPQEPEWWTTEQAAECLGMPERRVREMAATGRLKAKKTPGRRAWRILRTDAERIAALRRRNSL